jgi:hypothetical protein
MYNLFVTAETGTWDGNPYTFGVTRVIREYTDEAIKQKYKALDEAGITELLSFPALFAYEETESAAARVGFIKRIRQRSNEVRIEYEFLTNLAPIPAEVLSKLSWELEIDNLEMNRTHWAVKTADLFQVLFNAGLLTKEQSVNLSAQIVKVGPKVPPTADQITGMTSEDRRNSGLILLLQLAQAYYKMLECSISMSCWCTAMDLELNESYFWAISSIDNLLKNHEDLRDFPIQFVPLFPDLYPSTIRDVDWEYMAAPEAERFLSAVQKYINSKGIYEPKKSTPAWIFVEMFRPSVNIAIDRAISYKTRMEQYARTTLGNSLQTCPSESTDSSCLNSVKPCQKSSEKVHSQNRDKVFISYSHKDKKFLDELLAHLKPLERAGRISAWSDLEIQPGSQWAEQIQSALSSTKVAVLLVTKDFLASDFIQQNELGPLLKAAREDGVAIRWVLVRDCNWKMTPLKDYQAAYPLDKPLARKNWSRDTAWVAICEVIESAANRHEV